MIKNYGLVIETEKDPNAYMLGALAKEVLQPSGQWDEFLPTDEHQAINFETFGCTCYGTLNAQEILLKRLEGKEYNFAERYPYNLAEINEPGADPHIVAEKMRKNGSIPEASLPRTKTLKDFATPRPMTKKYLDKGQEFPYELRHEFIFYRTDSQATKIKKIKEALKYSPVCLSVTAWHEENGVYVDMGKPNTHWTVIYGWSDKGWKCLDSYSPYKKIVSFDHQFEIGKVYQLVKKTDIVEAQFTLIGYLNKLVDLLKEMLKKKPMNKITELALAKEGTDFTPDWIVPDEVSCAYALTTILKEAIPDFPIITGTWTLDHFLAQSTKFERVPDPVVIESGDIVVSPTGTGNGLMIGHTGIYIDDKTIMSNNSNTGLWEKNYTRNTWKDRYAIRGGMPIRIYRYVPML